MTWTYNLALVATQARYHVRMMVGDTDQTRKLAQDEEVDAALAQRGLLSTADPVANQQQVLEAAALVADIIRGKLARQSEIVMAQMGAVKSNAAGEYARLAADLRKRAKALAESTARPSFANPQSYPTTYVEGVDPPPGLE